MDSKALERHALLALVADRLGRHGRLSKDDRLAVLRLADEPTVHRRGADLTEVLDAGPRLILSGWACQSRPLSGGGRQIFAFLLPGDFVGSFWPPSQPAPYRTVALTSMETAAVTSFMETDELGAYVHPPLVDAAQRAERHAGSLLFDHIVRLAARDAYAGLSHLLLELHDRLARVGLADGDAFRLPIGQRVLAQAMGFSVAHLNHTLQRMSADGLIEIRGDRMHLRRRDRMAALADFGA